VTMTFQDKAEALESLAELFIRLTAIYDPDGRWVASMERAEIGGDGMLCSLAGYGRTPEAAVDDLWRNVTVDLPPEKYVVVNAYGDNRRKVRWARFMWRDVPA
jgi:hypothetical protein